MVKLVRASPSIGTTDVAVRRVLPEPCVTVGP